MTRSRKKATNEFVSIETPQFIVYLPIPNNSYFALNTVP